MMEELNGYVAFYSKEGEPETIERKVIKPELKESYEEYFKNSSRTIPTEKELNHWLSFHETEKCVYCGVDTKVPIRMHIDYRSFYVEGAGQLCEACHNKVYGARMTNP